MRDVLQINELKPSARQCDDRVNSPISWQDKRLRVVHKKTRTITHVNSEPLEGHRVLEVTQLICGLCWRGSVIATSAGLRPSLRTLSRNRAEHRRCLRRAGSGARTVARSESRDLRPELFAPPPVAASRLRR